VSAEEQPPEGLGPAVEKMMRERFLDGLTRLLERRYPGSDGATYEDVVFESVARLLEVGGRRSIDDPRAYITTIAINHMRRVLKQAARDVVVDFSAEDRDEEDEWTPPRSAEDVPVESEAVSQLVFDYVKDLVGRWESHKLRATTLLVLEGAYIGEPLSSEEMAGRLADILGEDVLPSTVRKWRQRGLDRLIAQLAEEGFDYSD
jgi:DNA-directed RNA polymerase specialized sigma24 family protein